MNLSLTIGETTYIVLWHDPISIAIPMHFNGLQPNSYDAPKATAHPHQEGEFIGSVAQGGNCNFEQYTLIPHCNGTHTESIGHISKGRISINDILKDAFIPSILITVLPENAWDSKDTYTPEKQESDKIITAQSLQNALKNKNNLFSKALIIRTIPNDDSKKSRSYMKQEPPFFSLEAMKFIRDIGIQHLLVDIPSVDRTFDEGKLSNHRIFWKIEKGDTDITDDKISLKTITEMVYIPNEIKDGHYLLNLQIAPFVADAAPSRPVLFNVEPIQKKQ